MSLAAPYFRLFQLSLIASYRLAPRAAARPPPPHLLFRGLEGRKENYLKPHAQRYKACRAHENKIAGVRNLMLGGNCQYALSSPHRCSVG